MLTYVGHEIPSIQQEFQIDRFDRKENEIYEPVCDIVWFNIQGITELATYAYKN